VVRYFAEAGTRCGNQEVTVCGQPTSDNIGSIQGMVFNKTLTSCPRRGPTLIISGYDTFGCTGNHLRTFLHAVQFARDVNLQLGMTRNSWAMDLLTSMFICLWSAKVRSTTR